MVPVALNVFHIILMRTHIQTAIPAEMLEAAEIDGCSHLGRLVYMVLPLSGSILAVLVLYNVVGQWNSYFYAMMFLKDQDMYPLQIILRDILVMNSVSYRKQRCAGHHDQRVFQHIRQSLLQYHFRNVHRHVGGHGIHH